jgi:hypothetical protein
MALSPQSGVLLSLLIPPNSCESMKPEQAPPESMRLDFENLLAIQCGDQITPLLNFRALCWYGGTFE